MPSLIGRIARFARSPQGRRAMQQAQKIASDPNTKRKIAEAREKLAKRRGRP